MNNLPLNRIFTKNTIKTLIDNDMDDTYYAVIRRYINDIDNKNHQQLISEIYKKLKNNYRNEYFYKNTLLNKLLFGKHSPTTTTALAEVPINKSKADFILINGKAVVYEIKTELDNFERLETQLNDYFKAFTNVCVVTYESNLEIIEKKLKDTKVGIYILTSNNTISPKKEPISDYSKLDLEVIFKILRKKEYENLLYSYYKNLPQVNSFQYYKECKRLFKNIEINEAYKMFTKELKKRNKIDIELFKNVPEELKSVIYFSKFKNKDFNKLNQFLQKKYGG